MTTRPSQPPGRRVRKRSKLAAALALTLVGGGSLLAPTLGTPASAAVVAQADATGYPSLSVTNILTGKKVNLSKYNTSKVPTLAWFWAPH
jgi:hypothetical protein